MQSRAVYGESTGALLVDNLTIEQMHLRDVVAMSKWLSSIKPQEDHKLTRKRLTYCATALQLMQWATRPKTGNADRAAYRKALDQHWQAGRKLIQRYTNQ